MLANSALIKPGTDISSLAACFLRHFTHRFPGGPHDFMDNLMSFGNNTVGHDFHRVFYEAQSHHGGFGNDCGPPHDACTQTAGNQRIFQEVAMINMVDIFSIFKKNSQGLG